VSVIKVIIVEWKIFNYNDIVKPKGNIFDIKIAEKVSRGGKGFKLHYNPIKPPDFEQGKLFEVFPM
jgi:hypothetical protein